MRFARSFPSLMIVAALGASGCGGSPPPAPNTPDAPSAVSATPGASGSQSPSGKPSASDDEGWAGEKPAKDESTAAPASPSTPSDAEPAPANSKAPETRTMDVIRKLVMDHRKAARKCYEDARKDLKDLKGDVVIHFVLDPEGRLKSAELNQERSTLKAPPVVDCVIGVIRGIHFPKSSRAMETSANYPFNFTP